ncbi:uncharacterized protein CDAR_239671 [Caerostris darwini]|uniref:Uncharacterized protein n=1 Tax=Caerostris darwini TaxID=1538125 RepID=A0AAV4SN33_9ARAC|nr:uncharacterized protein CDAR_239671 [Caerostris darwini]
MGLGTTSETNPQVLLSVLRKSNINTNYSGGAYPSHLATNKKDCMIDSEKGWYDMDNVYTCEENQRCCKEYGNPSCCAEKNKWLIVKDQLVLWGGLFGFLSFLGLIVYCRRHDFYVLEGNNPCARCLGNKPQKLVEEDEEQPIRT